MSRTIHLNRASNKRQNVMLPFFVKADPRDVNLFPILSSLPTEARTQDHRPHPQPRDLDLNIPLNISPIQQKPEPQYDDISVKIKDIATNSYLKNPSPDLNTNTTKGPADRCTQASLEARILDDTNGGDRRSPSPVAQPEQQLECEVYATSHSPLAQSVIRELPDARIDNGEKAQDCGISVQGSLSGSITGVKVPQTGKFVFRELKVPHGYYERYKVIVDLFKRAVNDSSGLRDHSGKISYMISMCGEEMSVAAATILIFCTNRIFKDLRKLFKSEDIRKHYDGYLISHHTKWPSLLSWIRTGTASTNVAQKPPLKILFWRTDIAPSQKKAGEGYFHIQTRSPLSLCGALVRVLNRTATVMLIMELNSKLYGLTVDHILERDSSPESLAAKSKDSSGGTASLKRSFDLAVLKFILRIYRILEGFKGEGPQTSIAADELWDDDTIYYSSDDVESEDGQCEPQISQPETSASSDLFTFDCIESEIGFAVSSHDSKSPLDYLLVEINRAELKRPNCFFAPDNLETPVFFGRGVSKPSADAVEVWMVSGIDGVREGLLLTQLSFLSGDHGGEPHAVWNVIMKDQKGIRNGESGSLIVGKKSLEIYGHVVSSNPLGEGEIIRFSDTLMDIKSQFGGKTPVLPRAEPLLEELCKYYTDQNHPISAELCTEALQVLENNPEFDFIKKTSGVDHSQTIESPGRNIEQVKNPRDNARFVVRTKVTSHDGQQESGEEGKLEKLAKKAPKRPAARAEVLEIVAEPIKFKDAVGRKFSFPFHLGQSWQVSAPTPEVVKKLREVENRQIEEARQAAIDPAKAEEAREEGNAKFKNSDWPGAVAAYSEMIKRAPDDPRGYSNRAAAFMKLLEFPSAIEDCDRALKKDPKFIRAYIRKAQAYFGSREYSKCLEICDEAFAADTSGVNKKEIEQQQTKAFSAMYSARDNETEEQTKERIQRDPQIMNIVQDPVMQSILQQAQNDPAALQEHMKNPSIKSNINMLISAGVIKVGR